MPALNIVKITPIEILQNQDGVKGQLDNKDEQVNNNEVVREGPIIIEE